MTGPAAAPRPRSALPAPPGSPPARPTSPARPVRQDHDASRLAAGRARRRRLRHLRRLRRDLLVDFGFGLAMMLAALIGTAGLGVLALLEVPVVAVLAGSFLAERRLRRRAWPPPRTGRLPM